MNFDQFRKIKKESGLAAASTEALRAEIGARENDLAIFPLDVFPSEAKPFINALVDELDIPRSFVGVALLSAYSTAIGTSYVSATNMGEIYLPMWACTVGLSSSGKSLALKHIVKPLVNRQLEYDMEFKEKTAGMPDEKIKSQMAKTIIFRESHINTLVKDIMSDNHKGVLKLVDELIEWINGMNQMGNKEGPDEQFYLTSWNCAPYWMMRAGRKKFCLPRPFLNVLGGIQPNKLKDLFAKGRDASGFLYRMLFAFEKEQMVADPNINFSMPGEWSGAHERCIANLYDSLPVYSSQDTPGRCVLSGPAAGAFIAWSKARIKRINSIADIDEKETNAGIFGKNKEYALRLSAILHLAHKASRPDFGVDHFVGFNQEELVSEDTMKKALRLADYFFDCSLKVFEHAMNDAFAPPDVLMVANMLRAGRSYSDIGKMIYGADGDTPNKVNAHRQKIYRKVREWSRKYPRVFNASAR